MQYYNYVVPSIASYLNTGHIESGALLETFKKFEGKEAYYCVYDLENRESFRDYRGVVSPALGYFVIDFDSSNNLAVPKEDILTVINKLNLHPASFKVFFSGSKGFHLYFRQEYLEFTPSDTLPTQLKRWAFDLSRKLNLKSMDLSVYNANRKFRVPNSLHPKTGLHKVELSFYEIATAQIPEIQELARSPRALTLSTFSVPSVTIEPKLQAAPSYRGSGALDHKLFGLDPLDLIPKKPVPKDCIKHFESDRVKEGDRHRAVLALIYEWKAIGKTQKEIEAGISSFCNRNGIPDRIPQYYRDIDNAFAGVSYDFGCYSGVKYEYCKTSCVLYKHLDKSRRSQETTP